MTTSATARSWAHPRPQPHPSFPSRRRSRLRLEDVSQKYELVNYSEVVKTALDSAAAAAAAATAVSHPVQAMARWWDKEAFAHGTLERVGSMPACLTTAIIVCCAGEDVITELPGSLGAQHGPRTQKEGGASCATQGVECGASLCVTAATCVWRV